MTRIEISEKVEGYLHFNGIELSDVQKEEVVSNIEGFAENEENLQCEMVCEISSLIE